MAHFLAMWLISPYENNSFTKAAIFSYQVGGRDTSFEGLAGGTSFNSSKINLLGGGGGPTPSSPGQRGAGEDCYFS